MTIPPADRKVPFWTPVDSEQHPLIKVFDNYLWFGGRVAEVRLPLQMQGDSIGAEPKTGQTSMWMTILKIVSMILTLGILPLLALIIKTIIRCTHKFHWIQPQQQNNQTPPNTTPPGGPPPEPTSVGALPDLPTLTALQVEDPETIGWARGRLAPPTHPDAHVQVQTLGSVQNYFAGLRQTGASERAVLGAPGTAERTEADALMEQALTYGVSRANRRSSSDEAAMMALALSESAAESALHSEAPARNVHPLLGISEHLELEAELREAHARAFEAGDQAAVAEIEEQQAALRQMLAPLERLSREVIVGYFADLRRTSAQQYQWIDLPPVGRFLDYVGANIAVPPENLNHLNGLALIRRLDTLRISEEEKQRAASLHVEMDLIARINAQEDDLLRATLSDEEEEKSVAPPPAPVEPRPVLNPTPLPPALTTEERRRLAAEAFAMRSQRAVVPPTHQELLNRAAEFAAAGKVPSHTSDEEAHYQRVCGFYDTIPAELIQEHYARLRAEQFPDAPRIAPSDIINHYRTLYNSEANISSLSVHELIYWLEEKRQQEVILESIT
jgi:hypothetical protein